LAQPLLGLPRPKIIAQAGELGEPNQGVHSGGAAPKNFSDIKSWNGFSQTDQHEMITG
jgi:hypothetical protein